MTGLEIMHQLELLLMTQSELPSWAMGSWGRPRGFQGREVSPKRR